MCVILYIYLYIYNRYIQKDKSIWNPKKCSVDPQKVRKRKQWQTKNKMADLSPYRAIFT